MRYGIILLGGLLLAGVGATPVIAQTSSQSVETLEQGSTGPAVRALQERLNQLGYSLGVDGDFGPRTDAAVRAFQRSQGISVDGKVGPVTRDRLNRAQPGLSGILGGGGGASGGSSSGASGSASLPRPQARDSARDATRKARANALAARAAGRRTLVVSFEGLASYSQDYANELYTYQDARRAGQNASAPRKPRLSSYVAKQLIAPVIGERSSPDVVFLGEHTESSSESVGLPVVLAWRAVHGARLKLIVVGHSFGGHAALRLCKKLESRGVPVQHLLTLDARTLPGLYREFVSPSNVGEHHNYFQRSLWFPGHPIQGAQDHRLRRVRHTRLPRHADVRARFRSMLSS